MRSRTPMRKRCGLAPAAPGASSRLSSPRNITCWRPTTSRRSRQPVVAHRTSPTNLGLYLLSTIAACDFGWTGIFDTIERLNTTFSSMNRLERFRGHFYNWYDTLDLRPLEPKYVSSVDSGNLAGDLIALGNACREMIGGPVVSPQWLAGIADALELTRESLGALTDDKRTHTVSSKAAPGRDRRRCRLAAVRSPDSNRHRCAPEGTRAAR